MKRVGALVTLAILAAAYACGGSTDVPVTIGDAGAGGDGATSTSASSSSSSSSSTSSSSGSTTSSSSGGDSASDAPPASGIPLKFSGCVAFTPCDAPVDGSYVFTAGCIEDPLADFKAQCPGLVEKSTSGTIDGSLTLAAGTMTRNVTTTFSAKVTIPAACAQGAPCAFVGPFIQSQLPGSTASCTGAGACDCDVKITTTDAGSSPFTQTGSSITTGAGDTFDVCKTGKKLQYTQTAGTPLRPGTYDMIEK